MSTPSYRLGVGGFLLAVSCCFVQRPLLAVDVAKAAEAATTPPSPPTPPAQAPEFEEPSATINLADALALALLRDPMLASFAWEIRAQEAMVLQASLRPNPELNLSIENVAGSGEAAGLGAAETTLSMSQLFEFAGRRGLRTRLAQLDAELANWDYQVARMSTLASTARAFQEVVAAQELVRLAVQTAAIAEATLNAVEHRLGAGASTPVELAQARVALSDSKIELALAERELARRRYSLVASWGSSEPRFQSAVADFYAVESSISTLASFLERARQNPELARWTTELDRRRVAIESARKSSVPGLTTEAGIRHLGATEDVGLVLGLRAPLPFFDRAQGATEAAKSRWTQARYSDDAATLSSRNAITYHHHVVVTALEEIALLRELAQPEIETVVALSRDAYEQGRARLTDVLSSQRSAFEHQARVIQALARYHASKTELELLVGEAIGESK